MSSNAVAVKRPQAKRSALVVLLLVVALILTIIVIATPNLLRSRMAASQDRKSTRLNSSHIQKSRMPSSA